MYAYNAIYHHLVTLQKQNISWAQLICLVPQKHLNEKHYRMHINKNSTIPRHNAQLLLWANHSEQKSLYANDFLLE